MDLFRRFSLASRSKVYGLIMPNRPPTGKRNQSLGIRRLMEIVRGSSAGRRPVQPTGRAQAAAFEQNEKGGYQNGAYDKGVEKDAECQREAKLPHFGERPGHE